MKERPILFSAPMVRAILDGSKTQTRRIVRCRGDGSRMDSVSPYGIAGDRLWVRETWAAPHDCDHLKPTELPEDTPVHYRASWEGPCGIAWRPSIFLRRCFSRLMLEVTGVRAERLRDISEADAKAEGVESAATSLIGLADEQQIISGDGRTKGSHPFTLSYAVLWDEINGDRAPWVRNPWVWVIEFRKLTAARGRAA